MHGLMMSHGHCGPMWKLQPCFRGDKHHRLLILSPRQRSLLFSTNTSPTSGAVKLYHQSVKVEPGIIQPPRPA